MANKQQQLMTEIKEVQGLLIQMRAGMDIITDNYLKDGRNTEGHLDVVRQAKAQLEKTRSLLDV